MNSITLRYNDINGTNLAVSGTTSSSSTTLTGASSAYLTDIAVGDLITDGVQIRQVATVTSDTAATVTVAPYPVWSGTTIKKLPVQTFNALRVKGFDPVDDLQQHPGLQQEGRDGSIVQQNISIIRHFIVTLGVMQTYSDRLFIGNFIRANQKYLTYIHDGPQFTLTGSVAALNHVVAGIGAAFLTELYPGALIQSSGGLIQTIDTVSTNDVASIIGLSPSDTYPYRISTREINVPCVDEDPKRAIQTEWLQNIEIARFVELKLREAQAQTTFPS